MSYRSLCYFFLRSSKTFSNCHHFFRHRSIFSQINFSPSKMVFKYPEVKRDESVIDDYHGVKIHDPYRWLEDPDSEETKNFVDAQNAITTPYLESCPVRKAVTDKLTSMWDFPKYSCPYKEGDYYYFFMNTGLQNQSVLYQQDTLDGKAKVILDPNELCKEGLIGIAFHEFSEDGKFMAYALSEKGSDWNRIKIKDVTTGEDLPEVLDKVKFSNISWTHDNKGFFYSWFPLSRGSEGTETDEVDDQKMYYHRLNTNQSDDILCVEFCDHPKWLLGGFVSYCGKYLVVEVQESCKNQMMYYCNLEKLQNGITEKLPLECVISEFKADYSYVNNEGSLFTFKTDKDAPLSRLVNIDFDNHSETNWKDLIPEDSKKVLDWAVCVNKNNLLVCYMEDVKNVLSLHDLETGKKLHDFPLDVGTITGYSGKKKLSEMFFRFVSFLTPGVIYHIDLQHSKETKVFREITVPGFDASQFVTTQIFYSSKDGTKIPMFIINKKDLPKDGNAPTLLYGYGGFNISLLPTFSISRLLLIQNFGGIMALANIRGGGEYGEAWHAAGKILKRQNAYDDFIAAAEYLIENKFTNPKKLAIQGGSNGGTLVGACLNQRPDLYGCGLCQVGVMDLLRFHKFTIGRFWTSDFGNPDVKEEFHSILKFSPLHNIRVPAGDNMQFPSVLLLTGDHDDRVVPLHSLKFISELQYKLGKSSKQVNPLMIKIDVKSGHGGGKPTTKVIEELSDIYCFMYLTLGLKYED